MNKSKGNFHLFPVTLGASTTSVLSAELINKIHSVVYFLAEHPKNARRFLKEIRHPLPFSHIQIEQYNKKTSVTEIPQLLMPLLEGHDLGYMSDAGLPAVADPGFQLVRYAHMHGIRVRPYVGPSSLMLALMASGISGENFAFNSYLPIHKNELKKTIHQLSQHVKRTEQTQICIETPYRNTRLFHFFVENALPEQLLCVATDLTLSRETIDTKKVIDWKKMGQLPVLDKRPTIFILGSQ